jgi:hypothetical protein
MTQWSVIANRKDKAHQGFWTEWRVGAVSVGGTAAQAGSIVLLGPDGKIDRSLLPANSLQAVVEFSNPSGPEETTAIVTVAAPWVTADSKILCNPFGGATPDHGAEDAMAEGLSAYATNIVPGVGFDIQVYAPNGTWGKYLVNAVIGA